MVPCHCIGSKAKSRLHPEAGAEPGFLATHSSAYPDLPVCQEGTGVSVPDGCTGAGAHPLGPLFSPWPRGRGSTTSETPVWCKPWQVTEIPAISQGSCSQLTTGSPAAPVVSSSSLYWPFRTQETLRGSGLCPRATQSTWKGGPEAGMNRLSSAGWKAGASILAAGNEGKKDVTQSHRPLANS